MKRLYPMISEHRLLYHYSRREIEEAVIIIEAFHCFQWLERCLPR